MLDINKLLIKRHPVAIFCILVTMLILLNGCGIFETYDWIISTSPQSIKYAYKDNKKTEPKIEIGMSREEILKRWGKPEFIVIYSEAVKKSKYSDSWSYITELSDKGGIYGLGKHMSWDLHFDNNYLETIVRSYYHTQIRSSEERKKEEAELVDKRLKELIPNYRD